MTCVVTTAFAVAMVPLVSLVWTVLSRGLKRLDAEFFTSSMLGVVGEGGGAYHAILGTLIITGITAVISVPIGLLTAIYLVEYGTGRLKRCDHVPRRRDDRHPLDRGRPVRLRPVRDLLRPRRPAWASWARSPCRC